MKIISLLLIAGTFLTACGNGNNPKNSDNSKALKLNEETPVKMTFEEGLAYKKSKRKLVQVEGYIQPSVVSSFSKKGQTVSFYGRRNQQEGVDYYTTIPIGSHKNQMKQFPKEYRNKDVRMLDNHGNIVSSNQRVKLTGYLYAIDGTTYLEVTVIDKTEEVEINYESLNFPTLKEKDTYSDKNFRKPYQLEGRLSVPSYISIGDETSLNIRDNSGNTFTAQITTGTGIGQIEELGKNWTNKDFKIHIRDNKLVNLNQNVKVYGVLHADGLHVEEITQ